MSYAIILVGLALFAVWEIDWLSRGATGNPNYRADYRFRQIWRAIRIKGDLPAGNSAAADGPGGSARQIAGKLDEKD